MDQDCITLAEKGKLNYFSFTVLMNFIVSTKDIFENFIKKLSLKIYYYISKGLENNLLTEHFSKS